MRIFLQPVLREWLDEWGLKSGELEETAKNFLLFVSDCLYGVKTCGLACRQPAGKQTHSTSTDATTRKTVGSPAETPMGNEPMMRAAGMAAAIPTVTAPACQPLPRHAPPTRSKARWRER